MVKEGYILTKKQASDIFLVLSESRLKLNGKFRTLAQKIYDEFEMTLIGNILNNDNEEECKNLNKD